MVNFAADRGPFTVGSLLRRIKAAEGRIEEVASSLNTVGRATVSVGKQMLLTGDLLVKGGGSVRVEDGGEITTPYPQDFGVGDALFIGPKSDIGPGGGPYRYYTLMVNDVDGVTPIFQVGSIPPQDEFPDGYTLAYMSGNAAVIEGKNLAAINLPATGEGLSASPGETDLTSAGRVLIQGGTGGVQIAHTTTGSAANAYLDAASGRIYRSVSSQRYKSDVTDLEVDVAAVLQLVPRKFRMKSDVEDLGAAAPWRVGFIAEEAHDLGLDGWVTYNADGDPEAFDYPTYCVALQAAVRQLADRVAALEGDA